MTIGSHGHNHFNLGQIKPKVVLKELHCSKKFLSKLIKSDLSFIAYADGNFSDVVKDIAEDVGYTG